MHACTPSSPHQCAAAISVHCQMLLTSGHSGTVEAKALLKHLLLSRWWLQMAGCKSAGMTTNAARMAAGGGTLLEVLGQSDCRAHIARGDTLGMRLPNYQTT